MKNVLFLAFILSSCVANAQQTGKKKKSDCDCTFNTILQFGLLEGSAGSAFHVQSINGIRFKTWSTGIGIGLDKYRFRSIPIFLDVRKEFFNKPNTPFVYGDIGVNAPWADDNANGGNRWITYKYKGGIYYDAGIGYKMNLGKGRGLFFSGGYSVKKMRETQYPFFICDFGPCPQQEGERFNFTLKRFSLKAGLQL